ncbi:hypothetical protein [Flagellimonas marinaquae]
MSIFSFFIDISLFFDESLLSRQLHLRMDMGSNWMSWVNGTTRRMKVSSINQLLGLLDGPDDWDH